MGISWAEQKLGESDVISVAKATHAMQMEIFGFMEG